MMRGITFVLVALAMGMCSAFAQHIVVPAEERYAPYTGNLPLCGDAGVINDISRRFSQKESTYWHSTLEIVGYDRFRQLGLRANGADYIPRRYCIARAHLNDGKYRAVVYAVGEKTGWLGYVDGVEWCVVGLDRNFAYQPSCAAVRPFIEREFVREVLRERY